LPRVQGAGDTLADLAWACSFCNGHKYEKTRARDPETRRVTTLFNPRRQRWSRHFAWSEDFILINLRRALIAIGEHPPGDS
jgi:hypothetical protein